MTLPIVKRVQDRVDAMREGSRVVDLGFTVFTRPDFITDTLLASYIAMRLFVMLFPLAYVAIAGIGLYGSEVASTPTEAVEDSGLTGALATSVARAAEGSSRAHIVVLAVGLALAFWTGRSALRALRVAHASVWRLPVPKVPIASLGGPLLALTVLVVAWLGTLISRLREAGAPIGLTSLAFALVVGLVWIEASWRLPHTADRRTDLLPGAVLVGIGAPSLNLATQLYFGPKLARSTATYGALGGSLVFLTFLLVIAWTIVAGAELNAGVLEWRRRQKES
jgi:uncharacterized BrkB/YihY/UPF0761 family membrane protein